MYGLPTDEVDANRQALFHHTQTLLITCTLYITTSMYALSYIRYCCCNQVVIIKTKKYDILLHSEL